MGLFSFLKDAGKKIFGSKEEIKAQNPNADANTISETQKNAIAQYITSMGIPVKNFDVKLTGDGELTLAGDVPTQADYEKIALMAGNIHGISKVNNTMTVGGGAADEQAKTQYHTVNKGDTLWAIATEYYKDGTKYPVIVEANQPMIKDADEIYPGQVLRIPALA